MFNAKKFKQRQATAWSALAEVYDMSFSTLGHPAAMQMLLEAKLQEGETVLDLAAGTGIDAFLAMPMVGETGKLVGVDIAPGMVDVANQKVQARGLKNIEFEVMDAEKLTFKPNTFDACVCKWALVSFPDCHKALKEVLRVLKPGGRLSALVFGRPEGSQFVTIGARAAFKQMPEMVTHETGGPTDFQFGAEGALEAAFNAAGFTNVRSHRFALMISCADGEKYWDLLLNGAGNFSYKVNHAPSGVKEAVRREVVEAVERYQSPDGIRLPLEVVLGYGEKPSRERSSVSVPDTVRGLDDFVRTEASDVREVTPQEVARVIKDDQVAILDVRPGEAYASGRIPRSQSAPRGRLEVVVGKVIVPQATRQIVCYCDDGRAGALAVKTLIDMGYRNVVNLKGGLAGWKAAKLPVDTTAKQEQSGRPLFGRRTQGDVYGE